MKNLIINVICDCGKEVTEKDMGGKEFELVKIFIISGNIKVDPVTLHKCVKKSSSYSTKTPGKKHYCWICYGCAKNTFLTPIQTSSPYNFFLLNGDMELHRY